MANPPVCVAFIWMKIISANYFLARSGPQSVRVFKLLKMRVVKILMTPWSGCNC